MRILVNRFLSFFAITKDEKRIDLQRFFYAYPKSKKYVLVEAFQPGENLLALSFFLPQLCELHNSRPLNYYMMPHNMLKKLRVQLRFNFSFSKKVGMDGILLIGCGKRKLKKFREIAKVLISQNNNPYLFERILYKDILIGDLVYDQYLRAAMKPTIDFDDDLLATKLAEAISYIYFWHRFLSKNEVTGVCVSHTVYSLAIPMRILVRAGLPTYQVNGQGIHRMDSEITHASTEFKGYREQFALLPRHVQEYGKREAQNRLSRRFRGEIGVDMPYSTRSAFSNYGSDTKPIDFGKSGTKILVAPHDFFDSPHSFGYNLFPDYKIWLDFLAEISRKTDYDWFLKTHPDVKRDGDKILSDFAESNVRFRYLPKDLSHFELFQAGINVVLTIYGTVASEYPYFGKLAVNASVNNPHVAFEFCLSPGSIMEYERVLLDLPKLIEAHKPNIDEILEFYFMHHGHRVKSWLIRDDSRAFREMGTKRPDWSIFEYFQQGTNSYPDYVIKNAIKSFLIEKSSSLQRSHFKGEMGWF